MGRTSSEAGPLAGRATLDQVDSVDDLAGYHAIRVND